MPLDDATHRREADAIARELFLTVQALERPEQLVGVFRRESGPVVADEELAIAGASKRLRGSNSRVRVTLQADSSSAWNSQRPSSRRNGPSRSCMSMWCGGESVFSVVNQVRSAPKPSARRATTCPPSASSTCASSHQLNRRG